MRTLLGIVPVALFLVLGTHVCFQAGLQPDDSGYVALRVAENFRSGQGLIFNAGERRDLIDSPLWVSMLSLLTFSASGPLLLQALGLLFGVLVLLLMLAGPRSPLVGAGAALFAGVDGLFVARATAGGSEPFAALYLLSLYPILRAARGRGRGPSDVDTTLAVWAGLAGFVRYEFVIISLPVALGSGLRDYRRVFAWMPLVAACFGAALSLGMRWDYFGAWPAYWEPWPPTFASVARAVQSLAGIAVRRPLLVLALGILVSDWVRGRLGMGRRIGLAWGLFALFVFSLVPARGTDVQRQVAAALPLAYLLSVEAVWRGTRTRPALVAALLLLVAQPGWTAAERAVSPELDAAYARVGQWLRTHALPGTVVGAERVGALGYYSRMKMEDVAGRVSPRVAAARRILSRGADDPHADFRSMLRQEPDIVLVLPGNPVPSASIYVPNDDAVPESIRGPYRVYRWAGSPVWRPQPDAPRRD